MRFSDLIYFDQAATSFPKPPAVLKAGRRALTEAGGNPGRSGHRLSVQAAMGIYACREDLAAFFDAPSPDTPSSSTADTFREVSSLMTCRRILVS